MNLNNQLPTTHGIVHAGFSGMRAFVSRKKGRCKLIGFRLVLPHDTIPSTVRANNSDKLTHSAKV